MAEASDPTLEIRRGTKLTPPGIDLESYVSLGPSGIDIRHSTDSPLTNTHVMNKGYACCTLCD